jgi:ATP-dependent helicase/nuclease subunit A
MPKPLKILQASAGSGKTFSLTAHYLTLLFAKDSRYREILAVTFTNKATEEMKTRILFVLSALAKGKKEVNNIRDIILLSHPKLNPDSLQTQAEKIYRKILHDYGRFSVSTIDGFVQKVIRGFAFELGLDSGYALEMNFEKVKNDLADRLNAQLENNPNLLQWIINLALERIDSNKSWNYHHALTDLAGEIFKERYQPFEKAMQELLAEKDIDTLFSHYQSVTKAAIKDFEESIKKIAQQAAKIFDGTDPKSLKGMSRSPLTNIPKIADGDFAKIEKLEKLIDDVDEWFKPGNSDALYQHLNPVLNDLYQTYIDGLPEYTLASAVNENLYYLRLMQEMANLLKAYRQESGTLLISDAQNLLQGITGADDSNPSFIWEKIGSRYHHFLFDEFQDTSGSQWANFKPLLTNAMAEATGELVDHLIVGDVKQSIYRWRNGDWNILHQRAKGDIGEAYIVDDNLEANYRSTENIVRFNNLLFEFAPLALQQQLNAKVDEEAGNIVKQWWTEQGNDKIIPSVYSQAKQSTHEKTLKGGCISFNVLRTDDQGNDLKAETFRVAALERSITEIKRLVAEKGYVFGDICILVRSNNEAVQAVEALMAAAIPVISGEALLIAGNTAVKLLIDTMRSMEGLPKNTAIYKATCISLFAKINGTVFLPENLFGLENKALEDLNYVLPADLCNNWRGWLQAPLPELVEKLIAAYGLDRPAQSRHLAYLLALRDLAGNFASQGEKGLSAFLQWWEDEGATKALPSFEHSEAVQVITIHKSKGLAFRAVLLPFCGWAVDGRAGSVFWVPSLGTVYEGLQSIPVRYKKSLANSSAAKSYFEELLFNYMDALNMLYVATTRTKEHLFIVSQGKRNTTGKITDVGDLLVSVFKLFPDFSQYFIDDDHLLLDDAVNKVEGPNDTTEDTKRLSVKLAWYPLSDRLSDVLTADQENAEADLLSRNIALREGAILHEVLSRADSAADLEKVLKRMVLEGYLRKEEVEYFNDRVIQVINHPELTVLLNGGGQVLNEKSIIAPSGQSYRPDKVLVLGDKVTVIDYKFTQNEEQSHIRQVKGYKDLLLGIGYQHVDTYLFYALSGTLKAI